MENNMSFKGMGFSYVDRMIMLENKERQELEKNIEEGIKGILTLMIRNIKRKEKQNNTTINIVNRNTYYNNLSPLLTRVE